MKPLQQILKKEQMVVVLLLGILLLIIAMPVKKKEENLETPAQESQSEESVREDDWQEKQQQRLKEVLEKVEGIGTTDIFITFENTGEKVVEKDETETVYTKDAKGNQIPYLSSLRYPKINGVLIVAEGGDDPKVVKNIQEAVQALFQVEAHKIKVMKMN